ncbi:MAG TPA: hypothetical protein VHT73_12425, partial [Thermodesulfobacteriota bacterium]|nr:hypothetical protein [Thermodesulfobacteriota bacterium]
MSEKVHLSNVDEFLATVILGSKERPLKLAIRKEGDQGYISATLLTLEENDSIGRNGVDFELFPCECTDFDSIEISDFIGKPVFTSSAYELFDFVFMFVDQ